MTFEHKTALLPNDITFAYSDSGPVPSSDDYTTLLVIHGSAFNAHGFEHLHALSPSLNLRTILLTRRDYRGSSLYTETELSRARQGSKLFLDGLSLQLAQFLLHLIDSATLPKIKQGRKKGGIVILGWSMGATITLTLFSDPSLFSYEEHQRLVLYVKDLIIYDGASPGFGFPPPKQNDLYRPFADPSLDTPAKIAEGFKAWAASYFDQHDFNTPRFDVRGRTEKTSLDGWTEEQMLVWVDVAPLRRSEILMMSPVMQVALREMTDHVLFSPTEDFFPDVGVTYLAGRQSMWLCPWGALETRRIHDERVKEGREVRGLRMHAWNYNHLAHWEDPIGFLKTVRKAVDGELEEVEL